MNRRITAKTTERIKTALIAVLAVSALLLGQKTQLFNEFLNSIPVFRGMADLVRGVSAPVIDESGTVMREAARPLSIVVTNESGGHFGVRYDTELKNTLYVRTSGIFGEVLGSVGTFAKIGENAWRAALARSGVFYEYAKPVKLSVLSGWFASRTPLPDEGITLRRIFVTFGEDMNRIYFEDAQSGQFYWAGAESTGGRSVELGIYAENSAVFAYETGLAQAQWAPYHIIMPGENHPVVRVESAGTQPELLDIILAAFGESSQIKPSYSAVDGSLVYVGTKATVRVGVDGDAVLISEKTEQSELNVKAMSEGEIIERSRVLAAETIGAVCGGAEVQFDSAVYGDDGELTVLFSYYLDGGRVFTGEDGYAARVVFGEEWVITQAEFCFKSFEPGGDYIALLPEKQAFAAAGGEFILAYQATGSDRLMPFWTTMDPERDGEG